MRSHPATIVGTPDLDSLRGPGPVGSETTLPAMSQQPHPDRVRLLPWSISPWLIDGILLVLVALAWTVRTVVEEADLVVDLFAVVVAVVVILGRRHRPVPALALGVAATAVVAAMTDEPSILMPAVLIALYTVATDFPWRRALTAGLATMVVFIAIVLIVLEPGRLEGGLLAAVAWPAFATTAGAAIRASRESLAGAQERARRAEATRELEAQRRVVEERLRIARDVHDLVAHHLAVVNVQSGVASHVLRSDPDAAGTALEAVRSSASTAVTELGELLGVLRDPDNPDGPVEPTPDLDALDDLIASFSASGLAIEHRVSGAPRPLAPSVQVAAYRVVQEALTNAHKHGDGSALVGQRFDDEAIEIEVTNRVGSAQSGGSDGSGYGLIGMRERVEAVGGELSAGEAGGRFTVRAVLPALVVA